MVPRAALVVLSLFALFAPCASAQLREPSAHLLESALIPDDVKPGIGNLTHVLPQCQTLCDAYDVMNTVCYLVPLHPGLLIERV
ncbi:hypothetical protein B0H17DRAFT_1076155 [Mycena rosella]|uniref:Apple domain-containing protein n=1 Tax=Mycena rosella TaxID=1033263 RepID=A0AAD7D725_MYCRO|nr:hypothetical protein B0H17DRAFT_1076155 [Mycena rosella]